MLISYSVRLLCLALFSIGMIQILLSWSLRLVVSLSRNWIDRMPARCQERIYFAAPLVSHGVALLVTLLFVVPQYVRAETNLLRERVGIVCVTVALMVTARYLYAFLRAAQLLLHTRRVYRCSEQVMLAGGVTVNLSAEMHPQLAVMGLFPPRIVLSQHLLDHPAFFRELLDIAVAHEVAHVRHRDNLKYFMLASLAFSHRAMAGSLHRWRCAAENAADDDAVAGDSYRAILLAEALLIVARAVPRPRTSVLSLSLLPHEEELSSRIERLLRENSESLPIAIPNWRYVISAGACLLANTFVLLHFFAASLHRVVEYLLHLG